MEETIDVRELVSVLWKGKWLIAAITMVAVIIGALVSYLVMDPVYSTSATVSVNNGIVSEKEVSGVDRYIKGTITPAFYTERMKDPQVIETALQTSNVKSYNVGAVQSQLTITPILNTDLLQVTLEGANAAEAPKMLANLIEATKASLVTTILEHMEADKAVYATQLKKEKANLDVMLKQYQQQVTELGLPSSILLNSVTSSENPSILNLDGEANKALAKLSPEELSILNELGNQVQVMETVYQSHLTTERQLLSSMNVLNIDKKVVTVAAPVEQGSPVSPNPPLNMVIAFVIGLLASTGFVFLRYCWKLPK